MPEQKNTDSDVDANIDKKAQLQQQIIELQKENIELRKQLDALKASTPEDDVHWNKVSGGMTSEEVLAEGSLKQLQAYHDWIFAFGEKYIKPFVHHSAYAEMIGHMVRGLSRRLAVEEIRAEFPDSVPAGKTVQFSDIEAKQQSNPQPETKNKPDNTKKTDEPSKNEKLVQKRLLDD